MAAEVCLLLMQSLTGDCDATAIASPDRPPSTVMPSAREMTDAVMSDRASDAIAPVAVRALPQFGELCHGETARQLAICALPGMARNQASSSPADSTSSVAPMPLNLPMTRRPIATPTLPPPRFSAPPTVAASPTTANRSPRYAARPSNGSELFRQRQVALQSGQSYTRIAPSAYANQWQVMGQQPTYQDWQQLLAQEARAMAGGQGQNRLEVIVGDSLGLWLPPEMLPRDRLWLNQSISGDTTSGILQRVSTFANTRATTIHLMAGANDLKNGVPEAQIVSNLQRTVRVLQWQHPQAKIVVYSVLPTRRAEISNDRVRSLNAKLAQMTQQRQVEYRDLQPTFRDEWGHLRPDLTTDGLHLNPQGYALWQQAIVASAI
ncbi:GDSL-type esterase/lipase family protein [Halomicronema sp. CCY15110]|uniref:GDSL-type esterase/lipase family protein n=1 Tax=Halomicronema sp. CCY15110 TaxID=2767773 RepID=UPI001951272D|nr:GDSL-type esterase/lipase family protein [Halomicronema sp. CCY15110]